MFRNEKEFRRQSNRSQGSWALDEITRKVMETPCLVSTDYFRKVTHHMDITTCQPRKKESPTRICPVTKKPVINFIHNRPLKQAIDELIPKPFRQGTPTSPTYFKPSKRRWNLSDWTSKELKEPCLVYRCDTWESVDFDDLGDHGYLFFYNTPLKMAIEELNRKLDLSNSSSRPGLYRANASKF